jgi:ribosome recycling factor
MSEQTMTEEQMKKVIVRMQSEFAAMRTGRANPQILDNLRVDYMGSSMSIKQLANVVVADARTIEIRPWDKAALQAIEQAIMKSDLGMTPQGDGKILRLALPSLTAERRAELAKVLRKQSEEYRVAVRNVRRDTVEKLKRSEKDKQISKDELFKDEQIVQKLTDKYVKNIDDVLAAKEKEIMEV